MKECTFKPQLVTGEKNLDLSKSTMTVQQQQPQPTNADQKAKYEQLYALAKHQKNKQDKTKEDYEFEKNVQECTFQPKLQANQARKNIPEIGQSVTQDKHVQKQIDRLNKGREEKERVKLYHERGEMPRTENNQQQLNESQMTTNSKRPGTSSTANRRSPHDRAAVVKEANKKQPEIEVDEN